MGSLTYLRVGYGKEGGEGEAQHHGQLRQLAAYAGRERRSSTVRSVNEIGRAKCVALKHPL